MSKRGTSVEFNAFTPMKLSVWWLAGTYVCFLAVGRLDAIDNLDMLTGYIALTIALFIAGYWLRAVMYRSFPGGEPFSGMSTSNVKLLVLIGSLYYGFYGFTYLRDFGATSPSAIINAVLNPGSAYVSKFSVIDAAEAVGSADPVARVLTLLAVASTPLIPLLVLHWKQITGDLRILAILGLGLYAASYFAIGTQVGIAALFLQAGVAWMVRSARASTARKVRKRFVALGIAGGLTFLAYMSYTQGSRLDEVGASNMFPPNPIVERLTNERFARGFSGTIAYPTHGYRGLAYNLETPFKWTHGQGSSRAIDSYIAQYGGRSVYLDTYPARTEMRTGWPGLQKWATIYPWLASDLTFPGAALFMFGVGWWLMRMWHEAVGQRSLLSTLLLSQLATFIVFVPANNQLGITRPGLIALVSLGVLYVIRGVNAHLAPRRPAERLELGREVEQRVGVARVREVGQTPGKS